MNLAPKRDELLWTAAAMDAWLRGAANRAVRAAFDEGLERVNRKGETSCRDDAAAGMTAPLMPTALWYRLSPMRRCGLDTVPRSSSEHEALAGALRVYRYAPLSPFGWVVEPDSVILVGDVLIGTDKISHFFGNGLQFFDRYREARDAGQSEDDAVRLAIQLASTRSTDGWAWPCPASSPTPTSTRTNAA